MSSRWQDEACWLTGSLLYHFNTHAARFHSNLAPLNARANTILLWRCHAAAVGALLLCREFLSYREEEIFTLIGVFLASLLGGIPVEGDSVMIARL